MVTVETIKIIVWIAQITATTGTVETTETEIETGIGTSGTTGIIEITGRRTIRAAETTEFTDAIHLQSDDLHTVDERP